MDVARPDLAREKKFRQTVYAVTAVMVVVVIMVGVSRLEPAAPRVDRDAIYLDTVQRGPMVRQERGTGTLVPEQIRWIPATTDGTVERIVIRPDALVAPDTVILELINPELEQSALEARLNLEAAEARYSNRQVEVERELLNQRATLATTEAQLKTARLQADADGQLFAQGLVSSLQLQQSQSAEQEFDTRYALEQERLQMATDTVEAQLAVEQAEVDRLRTLYELRRRQVADLRVWVVESRPELRTELSPPSAGVHKIPWQQGRHPKSLAFAPNAAAGEIGRAALFPEAVTAGRRSPRGRWPPNSRRFAARATPRAGRSDRHRQETVVDHWAKRYLHLPHRTRDGGTSPNVRWTAQAAISISEAADLEGATPPGGPLPDRASLRDEPEATRRPRQAKRTRTVLPRT